MSKDRLLVVDDEPIVRESMSAWLADEGWLVDTAEGGREALEMARLHAYAAVLLDLRMPGVDGIETLRALRRLSPSLPVVMMTAQGDVATEAEVMQAGARDYVAKPFDPEEVCAALRAIVESRKGVP